MQSLQIEFETVATGIPETPQDGEEADAFAIRIAREKCLHGVESVSNALVIAADTCMNPADDPSAIFGKPGDRENAARMLLALSGKDVRVCTAVGMLDAGASQESIRTEIVYAHIALCRLDERRIERYLDIEPDASAAAGAIVADGAAPAICERISEDEPGTLSGLPMITLCTMLRDAGVELP